MYGEAAIYLLAPFAARIPADHRSRRNGRLRRLWPKRAAPACDARFGSSPTTRPGRESCASRSAKCDAIAIATHGRGGLGRLILGSVTHRVLAQSRIPVLAVR
jgi:hypothetical protein